MHDVEESEPAGDSPTPTAGTDLGAAVLQITDAVEDAAEVEAERTAAAALALPHTHGAIAIASMTDRLLTCVEGLAAGIEYIPVDVRSTRGSRALARWETLKVKGPAADPLGTWSYMRDLAHIACEMVHTLRERRAARQTKAFVGRPGMPPITPGAP